MRSEFASVPRLVEFSQMPCALFHWTRVCVYTYFSEQMLGAVGLLGF